MGSKDGPANPDPNKTRLLADLSHWLSPSYESLFYIPEMKVTPIG